MTPQPQQEYFLITDNEMRLLMSVSNSKEMRDARRKAWDGVHSRPAPSHSECYKKGYADTVANALSQHADCVKCLEEDRVTMLEHDATIRNQTLDEILEHLEPYGLKSKGGILHETIWTTGMLQAYLESLRSSEGGDE